MSHSERVPPTANTMEASSGRVLKEINKKNNTSPVVSDQIGTLHLRETCMTPHEFFFFFFFERTPTVGFRRVGAGWNSFSL